MNIDPLTGVPVVVVGSRQDRPNRPPSSGCPFCPGGLEAPDPYSVRWFPNRWPPMPDDRCEVVLYSPDHDASLPTIGVDGARAVIRLWMERTAALGRRPDVGYVLIFENRGAEVGATIPHPHGQIYAFTDVPPAAHRELGGDRCALCPPPPAGLVVSEADGWRVWVPTAPSWPYELLLAPVEHRGELDEGLAEVLVDGLARLDRLFDQPMPYMLWVHQRPTDGGGWPSAHVHVHVAGLYRKPGTIRYVAAGELGSGVMFNPVEPEDAAAALRQAGR